MLCDAIELEQSLEGTLKVSEKSLKVLLDKVYFIVSLDSLLLPLIPQENLFLR